jgi:NAD(P)H-dependent flavin oxidoreductase YrpB (nitropropane dioxygenase family)
MAGASAPSLSIAVANAGGLGSCGVLLMRPEEIIAWANEVRANSNGAFRLNNWIPDPPPRRDRAHEARVRGFLAGWGSPVPLDAGDATPLDFAAQCEAMLEAGPAIISSIMGLYPREFVARLKERGPEAKIHPAWATALGETAPEDTMVSRVFSRRAGRSIATNYVRAATAEGAPSPAPYPVQRGLTALMRSAGQSQGDVHRMQVWAGGGVGCARWRHLCEPAGCRCSPSKPRVSNSPGP